MSLQNPDNIVTEERLAQFYQQILPYMGGMPDVMMSKFSKSDIYSTDERMVGVWDDGKPLYEKVWTVTTQFTLGTSGNNLDVYCSGDSPSEMETIIEARIAGSTTPYYTPVYAKLTANNEHLVIARPTSSEALKVGTKIVFKYTKTTDSAVEIGDDTDYSTTEKIVGTWIDGKPIWQRTIVDACVIPGSSGTYGTVELGTDKQIIDYDGYVKSAATNGVPKYLLKFGGYSANGMNIYLNDPMGSFHIFSSGTDIKNKPIDLTVRYIKLS